MTLKYTVDLNSDLGESFGAYTMGMDEAVIPLVSSVNVACGYHAGDPIVMRDTVRTAVASGTTVGAHPGFPDLQGFGRRQMKLAKGEAGAMLLYQIGALDAFCREQGTKVRYVKPHGALYNMAEKDPALAMELAEAVLSYDEDLGFLSAYGSEMSKAAQALGLPAYDEFFADRAYEADGSLVARSKPGAMVEDAEVAATRVVRAIKEGKVKAIDGTDIDMHVDSVCVHGDSPEALAFVETIRKRLAEEGIEIKAFA